MRHLFGRYAFTPVGHVLRPQRLQRVTHHGSPSLVELKRPRLHVPDPGAHVGAFNDVDQALALLRQVCGHFLRQRQRPRPAAAQQPDAERHQTAQQNAGQCQQYRHPTANLRFKCQCCRHAQRQRPPAHDDDTRGLEHRPCSRRPASVLPIKQQITRRCTRRVQTVINRQLSPPLYRSRHIRQDFIGHRRCRQYTQQSGLALQRRFNRHPLTIDR